MWKFSTPLFFLLLLLLLVSVKNTDAVCGDNIIDVGEQCDNTTAGSCCLSTCLNATSGNVINTSPSTLTVAAPVGATLAITAATLQLQTTVGANLNYPVSYTVVSYAPISTTYVPVSPTVFTYNNVANRLEYTFAWAGSYVVTLASTYCSPSGSLLFTRTITNVAFSAATATGMPLSQAFCTTSSTVRDRSTTECDCSLNQCTRGVTRGGVCWTGYASCANACTDIRQSKPRSFNINARFLDTTGSSHVCAGTLTALACTCPAVCGDYIVDTGEQCDNRTAGSCCLTACSNSAAPTTTIPSSATITLSSSATQTFTAVQLTGFTTFPLNIQVVSVTGVSGLSAVTSGSNVVFNDAYTGTATVVFRTVYCTQTNVSFIFTRILTMNSCGNNVVNLGEPCDNSTAGGCCLPTCVVATSSTAINASPRNTSMTITQQTVVYIEAEQLNLVETANYPLQYTVVDAYATGLTHVPRVPPVFTYDNNLNRLYFGNGWAGNYFVTLASTYCSATNGTFYFYRNITNTPFDGCGWTSVPVAQVICAHDPVTVPSSKCDCRRFSCRRVYANPITSTCIFGYNLPIDACEDLLVPKPTLVTLTASVTIPVCDLLGNPCGRGPRSGTCSSVCGDNIPDVGEACDAQYAGSCCTTSCTTGPPTTTIASFASIPVSSATTQTFTTLQLTGTANYIQQFQVGSVVGLPGVSAVVSGTNVVFNTVFTGTVNVTLFTLFCDQTNTSVVFVRMITMNSCGNSVADPGEICDGPCCGTDCNLPSNPYPLDKNISLATCTPNVAMTYTTTGLSLTGNTTNYNVNYTVLSVEGVPGVGATATATTFTFNTTFTGTVKVVLTTITCAATGENFTYTRFITSTACCGNSVINPGETCDQGSGVNGVSTSCCSSACQIVSSSSNQVCRVSAGVCDVAEVCNGVSPTCPANVLLPSTTLCRGVGGPCDVAEFCTGSAATCPSDAFVSSGTVCRNTSDLCDTAATCSGSAAACPVNGFASTSIVCRASAGICDPQETCSGSSYACPANVFSPSSTQCRASTGICDPAEFCIFNNASCPSDSFLPSSSPCRAAVSVCDQVEFCTGSSGPCPADVFQPSGTVCRANVSICDVAEVCNGVTTACPADSFAPSSVVCRVAADVCDIQEQCTGTSSVCPVNVFAPSTSLCRASTNVCDAPEYCVFNNASCPSDAYYNSSVVCRTAVGLCDQQEFCTGSSVACPVDTLQPSGFVCRPIAGFCDVAETCSGSSTACPVDAFRQNTVVCRNQSGACDVPEYCTGTTATCPVDFYASAGTLCRPIADLCDVAESCDGVTSACPIDDYSTNGTVCRASAGICDQTEVCNGLTVSCPANVFFDSSVVCNPSLGGCDPAEFCSGSSALCPTNVLTANGIICNASTGSCENNARCDGSTPACPAKVFYNSTVVCRSSAGLCDLPENCPGDSAACPANIFRPSSFVCNPSTGVCMPDSYCDGSTAPCTILPFYNNSVVCRPSIGNCDIDDYCTGSAAACSSNAVQPSGYVCDVQVSNNTCKVNTTCSGLSGVCTPTYLNAGSSCNFDVDKCFSDTCVATANSTTQCVRGPPINYDDGLYCNGVETCNPATGLRVDGTPVVCNDGTSCTIDTCSNALNSCVFTPVANSQGPCGGGIGACTPGNYSCNGVTPTPVITCVGAVSPIMEICFNGIDDNCNGQIDEFCTGIPCNTTQDCFNGLNLTQCNSAYCNLGQCTVYDLNTSTPCNDGFKCTRNDHCNGFGECVGTAVTCDDQNDCTQDYCSEQFGQCIFNASVLNDIPCEFNLYTEAFFRAPRAFYDPCVAESKCNNGQCVITATLSCPVVSECEAQVCNTFAGLCQDAVLTGKPCQLGDVCNLNGVCIDGEGCVTAPRICDDFITCTTDTCVQRGGDPCDHSVITGLCLIDGQCYTNNTRHPYNPCLSCRPSLSASEWSPTLGTSVACDDGNLCTVNDVCSFGTCSGVPVDCSAKNGQCTVGVCERGMCSSEPTNIGDSCSDGLACTSDDTCTISGECTGEDLNCAQYSTQCSVSVCSEIGNGCVLTPLDDYTRCQLNTDLCDGQEYCLGGVCVAGDDLSCTTDNTCMFASCDPLLGCVLTPRTNSACNDSNACTIGDSCNSDGLCYPGATILDCDDCNPCTYDLCDAQQGCLHETLASCTTCVVDSDCDSTSCQEATCIAGTCTYNALLAGTSCGEDQACSRNDYCTDSGVCITLIPESCNDNNPCTLDSCTPGLGCVFTPLTATPCNDTDLCTINDQCSSTGECLGTPYVCPVNTDCIEYECQVISGAPTCVGVPRNLGGSCTTTDLCQVNGHCLSNGLCSTVDKSCPEASECTPSYSCSGGACNPNHSPLGTVCNSRDLCTPWSCDGAGVCLANTTATKVCPFNATLSQCQREPVCIPHTGECYPQFLVDGASCDDGNLCTSFDTCHGGVCLGEEYYNCSNDDFTLDCHGPPLCHPVNGCYREPLPDGEPCYYNDGCATLSICQGGVCMISTLTMPCEDVPCQIPSCDPLLGCVQDTSALDGAGCTFGNLCYSLGTCASGNCQGLVPISCSDSGSCGLSYCSPTEGCLELGNSDCHLCNATLDCPYIPCKTASCSSGVCSYTANNAALSGCDDGLYCNGVETCAQGTCILGDIVACDDDNLCTIDSCSNTLGSCVHTPNVAAINTSCLSTSDDKCALTAQCNALGECVSLTRAPCVFTEPCRVSLGCNATTGGCSSNILDDGVPCIANDPCASPGTCLLGVCVYAETKNCSAFEGDFCTQSYVCNRQEGGSCDGVGYVPTACSDDNSCSLGDVCLTNGTCASGIYSPCEFTVHNEDCQYITCELDGSCTINDYTDGTPCSLDDSQPTGVCSGSAGDSCQVGVCTRPYAPGLLCRPADASGCDVDDYCVMGDDHCPEDVKAASGVTCIPSEYCSAPTGECSSDGYCLVTQPRDCSAYDSPCTVGVCSETTASCISQLRPENEACDDPDLPCVEHTGCYFGYCLAYAAPSRVNCTDDNDCTSDDHCSGVDGTCLSGATVNCSSPSQNEDCVLASCNATTGLCEYQPINEGGPCNADDNLCTTGDSCQVGICVAGPGMDCSYLDNSCQRGVCTSATTCDVEILSRECSPGYCEGNCTAGMEWWTVHSSHTSTSGLFTWPGNFEQLVFCGKSYYDWAQQAYEENAWVLLFHQWLAASLNNMNGACLPNTTSTAIDEAFTLLSSCDTTSIYFTNSTAVPYRELIYTLYSYNSGVHGPGLCDPSYCFNDESATAQCLFIAVPYFST